MSKAPAGPPGGASGLPPFEPPVPALSSLSSSIQISINDYEDAKTPKEKATALQKIQLAATKLSRATTPLHQQFMQNNFGPNVNVAVRIALEMGLFVGSFLLYPFIISFFTSARNPY